MLDDTRRETVSQASNGELGTKEAEALASALNHSAERVQTLWFSFLTFMLYLAIATGSTTDRMLFLKEPLKLPVLNIPLPLLGFYELAPFLFVVFHFYMLLNLVLLARTAKSFEDALARAFPENGEARENFRMRIENTLFAQLLVGARREREGFNARLLSLIALITLAVAPVYLLLMFGDAFISYHDPLVTWWHRGLLLFDLMVVWTLWPGYRRGWGVVRLWAKPSWRFARTGVLSALILIYAVAVDTYPDQPTVLPDLGERLSGDQRDQRPHLTLVAEALVDGEKVARIEKNESLAVKERWQPASKVEGRNLIDEGWEPAFNRAGDLTAADLRYADIRYVDFSNAVLNRALLSFARATNANFYIAQLKGAHLYKAQLEGADFRKAGLQGASLGAAELQGASLGGAQLQGANLSGAHLQGASLDSAQLQGANLSGAHLQGATLDNAQLQGASLKGAQLQGASLSKAELQGASFTKAFVWRADAREAHFEGAKIDGLEKDPKYGCHRNKAGAAETTEISCDYTTETFEKLKKTVAERIPEGNNRRNVMEAIEHKLDPKKDLSEEHGMETTWAAMETAWADRASSAQKIYEKSLAVQWQETGCAAEEAPYVVRGLFYQLDNAEISPFDEHSPEVPKLAAAFLDTEHCPGARGLWAAEITKLKEIRDRAPPPAPKQ